MTKLLKNLLKLSNDASGAFQTRADRDRHVTYLCDFLRLNNINVEHVSHLKASHIKAYVSYRKDDCGVSVATITNEMASIRKVLKEGSRHQLVHLPSLTNKELNIGGRSRVGNKSPIPTMLLNGYLAAAFAYDLGYACAVLLGFELGLRDEEAIQAYKSINTWINCVAENAYTVKVIFGTKGGRPRDTIVLNHAVLLETLSFCQKVMKLNNGYLFNKKSLKEAKSFLSNSSTQIGLIGEHSFMSLRYTYTNFLMLKHDQYHYTQIEKLALASTSLGHSSGRVNYVKSVYGRNLLNEHQLNFSDLVIQFPNLNSI